MPVDLQCVQMSTCACR